MQAAVVRLSTFSNNSEIVRPILSPLRRNTVITNKLWFDQFIIELLKTCAFDIKGT